MNVVLMVMNWLDIVLVVESVVQSMIKVVFIFMLAVRVRISMVK